MYVEPRLGKIVLALACGLGVLSAWGCCGSQQRCHSSCGCGGVYAEGAVLEPIPANGHGGCRGCRGKNGGYTTNRDDATEPQLATKPRVLPPHSRFHPVPTRPVFRGRDREYRGAAKFLRRMCWASNRRRHIRMICAWSLKCLSTSTIESNQTNLHDPT